jgi:hypothetical protein
MWQVEADPSCDKQHNRQSGFPAFGQFSSHAKMKAQTRVGKFKENTTVSLSNQSMLGKFTSKSFVTEISVGSIRKKSVEIYCSRGVENHIKA